VSALLLVMALYIGSPEGIGRLEGIILFLLYIVFVLYSIRSAKQDVPDMEAGTDDGTQTVAMMGWGKVIFFIAIGLAGLIYGGDIFVESATNIAKAWGVSEAVIAITLVAVGTSLPELAASLASIFKGSPSLALGNVIGSNIANILLILGACSSVAPLKMVGVGMVDICVVVATSVLLLLSALFIGNKKITRFEGVLFLCFYSLYIYTLL
jgi:cation:H+ antiporter